MSLDDSMKELWKSIQRSQDLLRRLKGNDDDGMAGVLARKKPPKYPYGPSRAKAQPEGK